LKRIERFLAPRFRKAILFERFYAERIDGITKYRLFNTPQASHTPEHCLYRRQNLFGSLRSNIQPSKPVKLFPPIAMQERLGIPFGSDFRWVGINDDPLRFNAGHKRIFPYFSSLEIHF